MANVMDNVTFSQSIAEGEPIIAKTNAITYSKTKKIEMAIASIFFAFFICFSPFGSIG